MVKEKNQEKPSDEVYKAIFQYASSGMALMDKERRIIEVNDSLCNITGYNRNELFEKSIDDLIDTDEVLQLLKELNGSQSITKENRELNLETQFISKNGNPLIIEWKFTFLVSQGLILGVGKDITDAKRLKTAIENEKLRFAKMFEEAPVMMAILKGSEHVFENVNELYYQFSGRQHIIGKKVREVFPEAERQGIFEIMDKVYQTGETYKINERKLNLIVSNEGRLDELYLTFMFQPYRDQLGRVEGIFYFGIDVTEQVLARKKIEESKKQYIDLIQNLPAAVYTCDVSGKIELYNKAALELWGKKPYENDKWFGNIEIYNLQDEPIPANEHPMARVVQSGRSLKEEEIKIRKPNGEFRYVMSFPSPVLNSEGRVMGGVNVLVDITDRKKIEEERGLLSLIAKRTINAVIITNPEGKIEWVNEGFKKLTGFNEKEVIGKKRLSILKGKSPDKAILKFIRQKIKERVSFECELLQLTKKGKPFWVEIHVQPIYDAKNKLVHFLEMQTDITERKKAYEDLQRRKNEIKIFARELNHVLEEERSRLAREIHDEFGQQLTGLKMSLSSLLNYDNINKPVKEILSELVGYVDHSIQVLRNISTELRPGILDTLGLIPSLEWLAKEFEKRTGICCEMQSKIINHDFDKDLSITFFRVCQEALTNVSKHAAATSVKIDLVQNLTSVCLSIEDNGKGIRKDKLKDPFSKGLLGMRERANLIDAKLEIVNRKNKGTTVQIIAERNG